MHKRHLLVFLAFLLCGCPMEGTLAAPPLPTTAALPAITPEQIDTKIKELESAADLDDALKKNAVEVYRKAQTRLETMEAYQAAARAYTQAIQNAPVQAKEIRERLERTPSAPPAAASLRIGDATPLSEIEQRLTKEKADKAALEAKLSELDKKLREESDRPSTIRERLREVKQLQEQLAAETGRSPAPDLPLELGKAYKVLLPIRERALSAEVHMLDQELLSQAARIDLLRAQQAKTTRSLSNVSHRAKLLEDLANERRQVEAAQNQARAIEVEQQMAGKHPLIAAIAETNAQLSKELAALATRLDGVAKKKERAAKGARQIESDLKSAKQKLQIAGLSQVLGSFLVEQREKLNHLLAHEPSEDRQEQAIGEAGLRQLQLTEERRALADIDAALERRMDEVDTTQLSPQESQQIKVEARKLLQSYRGSMDKAIDNYDTYLRQLNELDFGQRQLYDAARRYSAFLDEHLLWTPNTKPVGLDTLAGLPSALGWFFSPTHWRTLGGHLAVAARSPLGLLVLVAFALLLHARARIRGALLKTGDKVGHPAIDRFGYTLKALGLTVLLALPWPMLMVAVAWGLQGLAVDDQFSMGIARALDLVAGLLFNLSLLRLFCMPGGVAEAHFRWPLEILEHFRLLVRRFVLVALPAAFVASATNVQTKEVATVGLSWLGFVVVMVALAVLFHRIFYPKRGVLAVYYRAASSNWLARLRYLWYLIAAATPLVLGGVASVGYFYAAGILTRNVIDTLWLVLGIVVVRSLVVRWLVLARRRLARRIAREKREAGREEADPGGFTEEAQGGEEVDLAGIDAQTRELINALMVFGAAVGVWTIWAEVVPALGILDQISLWHSTAVVDGEQKSIPVTLANLGLALVLAFVTAVATRNLPGLLEIILLQRLSMQSGTRYAIIALASYTILSLGVIAVFSALGGRWSQIQWLVAAVSVGLGFGLQEIFGNFISGLIILFERPIRVGDIVTVGDTTGVVSRIRIRATVITNWDKQELLVPNKEFITGRLLNWTLSNQMNRIVISVGIAYGSDVNQALRLLSEAAVEHPKILEDPAPMITFEGFADSSLTLILRCYLDSLEFRLSTISELHQEINRKFNAAGVVIAFPQQDVHLDTSRPLDIKIQHAGNMPPSTGEG